MYVAVSEQLWRNFKVRLLNLQNLNYHYVFFIVGDKITLSLHIDSCMCVGIFVHIFNERA